MSEMDDLRREVAALRDDVAFLRTGGRLGPRQPTQAEEDARAKQVADTSAAAIKKTTLVEDVPPVDRTKLCTTDGRSPAEALASQTNETGQHASYIVLCDEERAKGWVRPFRDSYKHVGAFQQLVNGETGENSHAVRIGGCGTVTTMGRKLSETYARDPKFYSHTFCVHCNRHPPVSEFVWTVDGQEVGS